MVPERPLRVTRPLPPQTTTNMTEVHGNRLRSEKVQPASPVALFQFERWSPSGLMIDRKSFTLCRGS